MTARKLSDVFRAATERVRRGWTKRFYAANAHGEARSYDEPDACLFCLVGALFAEGPGPLSTDAMRRVGGITFATRWNDEPGRTQRDVVLRLERIAGELESEGL